MSALVGPKLDCVRKRAASEVVIFEGFDLASALLLTSASERDAATKRLAARLKTDREFFMREPPRPWRLRPLRLIRGYKNLSGAVVL